MANMLPSLTAGRSFEIRSWKYFVLTNVLFSFTLTQLPRTIADAIYGRVQGAEFDSTNQWWTVPCGQYLNVSFNFGGNNYPIHPLDLVDNNSGLFDSTGNPICLGAVRFTISSSIVDSYFLSSLSVPTNYICLQYIWNI